MCFDMLHKIIDSKICIVFYVIHVCVCVCVCESNKNLKSGKIQDPSVCSCRHSSILAWIRSMYCV